MHFIIEREKLLKLIQLASGIVEKKQTLPILSNVLLALSDTKLSITATDLEIELITYIEMDQSVEAGEITVNARKLFDICKSLPEEAKIEFVTEKNWIKIKSGKSHFNLVTLPANEFPSVEESTWQLEFFLPEAILKTYLENCYFAMAQQDVRYYLNGMLFEIRDSQLKFIATNGHRMALGTCSNVDSLKGQSTQVIVPRKGVLELMRLLSEGESNITLKIGSNHLQVKTPDFLFMSKLIDGKFPDYSKGIPKTGDKVIYVEKESFKQALTRVAILSNEKYRGIRLLLSSGAIKIMTNNPEQEEAEEELAIDYQGPELEIGFNVNYLLDVCNVVRAENVKLTFSDINSCVVMEDPSQEDYIYFVMPMQV
ncbi:MAG: DNA polymerase III subunit beta [Gammaproteobacteria bacterium]|nr:DNA polymerase III subunit beta [Gammaproteobacteria bacterium]MBU2546668.1 DNA polymerase III subunit beta [Gammaproteobacteria bacterium]